MDCLGALAASPPSLQACAEQQGVLRSSAMQDGKQKQQPCMHGVLHSMQGLWRFKALPIQHAGKQLTRDTRLHETGK